MGSAIALVAALCLPVGATATPACSRAKVLATFALEVEKQGFNLPERISLEIEGPFHLVEFAGVHKELVVSEALRTQLTRARFYFANLAPVPPPGHVTFGGGYTAMVDAESCAVLHFVRGK